MKITLWDIKGFGRFNQSKITPGQGFNMIYEANESGKSTLQAFIRAMFYGLKGGRRAKDGSLPPAKHFKPWNSDQYAGVLEYTLENGASFRVGRNFDKGTANIYDGVSNNLTADFPQDKDIGPKFAEEHLGLDEATFEKSIFIRQMQSAIDDDGRKSLVEKLSNLSTTGSEDLSFTRAMEALNTALLERVGTGRTTIRPLDKINIRLSELEQRKQAFLTLNERYLNTRLELHEKKSLLDGLSIKLEQKKKQKEALKKGRLAALNQELLDLRNEADALDRKLSDCENSFLKLKDFENIAEDSGFKATMLLRDITQAQSELDAESARLASLEKKTEFLKNSMDSDEEFRKKVDAVEDKLKNYTPGSGSKGVAQKSSKNKALLLAGGLLSIIMLGLYFTASSYIFLALGMAFALATGILLALPGKKGSSGADILAQALSDAGFNDMAGFLQYKEAQLKHRSMIEQNTQQIVEAQKRIMELQNKAQSFKQQLAQLLEQAGRDYSADEAAAAVIALKQGIDDLKKVKEDHRILNAKRKGIDNQYALKFMEAGNLAGRPIASVDDLELALQEFIVADESPYTGTLSEAQLNSDIAALEDQIKRCQLEITALNTRLEQAPSEGELSSVIEEIALLEEKKAGLELTGSSLTLAAQVLSEAALKLQRDYIPELNHEMSRLLEHLTRGRYRNVRTNDELQVNLEVPETDELIPVSRLSGGTIDQVYFCMRLAAVRLLEKGGEKLPLFLDEPFSQYDEDRVRAAFEILRDISEERQIFFFTCREREFELAQSVFGDTMNRIRI